MLLHVDATDAGEKGGTWDGDEAEDPGVEVEGSARLEGMEPQLK